MLADKGYDSNAIREAAANKNAWANIPSRSNRKQRFAFSGWLYRQRNLVERFYAGRSTWPDRLRILSPFDPALRDRARAERLFGFYYRIEVFVPEPKRQYGYYVFPLLEGDRLIGRIDMKAERREGVLDVRRLWLEPGIKPSAGRLEKLEAELQRVARFAGMEAVRLQRGSAAIEHRLFGAWDGSEACSAAAAAGCATAAAAEVIPAAHCQRRNRALSSITSPSGASGSANAASPAASAAAMRARTRPTSRKDQSMPSATRRVWLSRSNNAQYVVTPIRRVHNAGNNLRARRIQNALKLIFPFSCDSLINSIVIK